MLASNPGFTRNLLDLIPETFLLWWDRNVKQRSHYWALRSPTSTPVLSKVLYFCRNTYSYRKHGLQLVANWKWDSLNLDLSSTCSCSSMLSRMVYPVLFLTVDRVPLNTHKQNGKVTWLLSVWDQSVTWFSPPAAADEGPAGWQNEDGDREAGQEDVQEPPLWRTTWQTNTWVLSNIRHDDFVTITKIRMYLNTVTLESPCLRAKHVKYYNWQF